MADYTFHSLVEPLKNNSTIQTILNIDALAAPAKTALAAYVTSLGLPAAETQHLNWENVGVAVFIRSLAITYYLPSLGTQTPAADVKRTSTLRDRVTEMQKLQSAYPKCQLLIYGKTTPSSEWIWLNTEVIQNSGNQVNTLKLLPYINQMEDFAPGRGSAIGIQFIADPATNATLPQAGDRITAQGSVFLDINPIADSKKNDEIEELRQQVSTLQLAVEGRLVGLAANTFLGKGNSPGIVEAIPQSELVQSVQGKKGNVSLTSLDLPLSNCSQLTNRSNTVSVPFDADHWVITNAFEGVKWIDGGQTNLGLPVNTGILRQTDPLSGTSVAGKYRRQDFYNGSRFFVRAETNGAWGVWREVTTSAVT